MYANVNKRYEKRYVDLLGRTVHQVEHAKKVFLDTRMLYFKCWKTDFRAAISDESSLPG